MRHDMHSAHILTPYMPSGTIAGYGDITAVEQMGTHFGVLYELLYLV